ncbi:MAG: hypothetical protein MJE68_27040 [Proteobacteria bacterium]|nr:hypothetical protein [Pseudomonadota bacterium]
MDHVLFQSPEYRTVLTLTEKLVIAVKPDLVSLGNKMLSRHIIVAADHDIVTGTGSSMSELARANHLITRIRDCVIKDPQIFLKFVEILAEEPSNSTIAKELLETRNRLKEGS